MRREGGNEAAWDRRYGKSYQHNIVVEAWIKLRHVDNRVIVRPQPFDNRSVHALIGQKIHVFCPVVG